MAGFLEQAAEREQQAAETLRVLAEKQRGEKRLAVCERASGELVLCRQRTRVRKLDGEPVTGADGKPERETFWKPSAALADFADAVAAGLL